jgi:hypothetical protein
MNTLDPITIPNEFHAHILLEKSILREAWLREKPVDAKVSILRAIAGHEQSALKSQKTGVILLNMRQARAIRSIYSNFLD